MKKALLLLLSISLFSCSNSDDDAPKDQTDQSSSAVLYLKASLDGQPFDYVVTDSPTSAYGGGYYNGSTNGPDYFDKSYHYGCEILPTNIVNFYPRIGLTFNNMYNSNNEVSESDIFYDLFINAPTNFITQTQSDDLVKGIDVTYQSPSGVTYSTLNGDQTGSTMTVSSSTSSVEGDDFVSLKVQTLVGTIKCKLYNTDDVSDVIVLTNGTYKVSVRQNY